MANDGAAEMPLRVYLDTNALIEFRDFRENDWLRLLGEPSVALVIAHAVVVELQRLKDGSGLPRRKKQRAGNLLRSIETLLFPEANAPRDEQPIRSGVTVEYDRMPPSDETFAKYHLDRQMGDGRLVAAVVTARDRGQRVSLVSNDFGARLLAKGVGIPAIDMPEEWRLDDEPDAAELENRDLKKRLAVAESRAPKLSLSFVGGANFIQKDLPKARLPVDEHADAALENLRFTRELIESSAFGMMTVLQTSAGDRTRYKKQFEAYLGESYRESGRTRAPRSNGAPGVLLELT